MAIPVYLQQFKAAGIYRVVFDKSTVLNQDTQMLRLVVGYSEKGPFNIPVYIKDPTEFKQIFGEPSRKLEKRGIYFHRLALQMLQVSPILCLNLKKFDGETVMGASISTDFNPKFNPIDTVHLNVEDIYDTNRFWELDENQLNGLRSVEGNVLDQYINIAITDNKASSGTYFIRKANGTKVSQYNITVNDWYSDKAEEIPEYLEGHENNLISDYFAEIYVFKGKFTAKQILASETLKNYFVITDVEDEDGQKIIKLRDKVIDPFGESIDTLDALYNDNTSNAIGHWIGCLIPDFKNKLGQYAALNVLFNSDADIHHMMMSFNTDMLDEGEGTNIDLSGRLAIPTSYALQHKLVSNSTLSLTKIYKGDALTTVLGNVNAPVIADEISFKTNIYDIETEKPLIPYSISGKNIYGTLYVSEINLGDENIEDIKLSERVKFVLSQVGDPETKVTIHLSKDNDSINDTDGSKWYEKVINFGKKLGLLTKPYGQDGGVTFDKTSGHGTYYSDKKNTVSAFLNKNNPLNGPETIISSITRLDDVDIKHDISYDIDNIIKFTFINKIVLSEPKYCNENLKDGVYGPSVSFINLQSSWKIDNTKTINGQDGLIALISDDYTDNSLLSILHKGDTLLANDGTNDFNGDGKINDDADKDNFFDNVYVQDIGTEYYKKNDNEVKAGTKVAGEFKFHYVLLTGEPLLTPAGDKETPDSGDEALLTTYRLIRIENSLNQEIGTMIPQYLEGYVYKNDKPKGTGMYAKLQWQNSLLSALTDYKGLRTALLNKSEINYRYVIDTFESFPDNNLKNVLSYLCKEKQSAFCIANFPSIKTFIKCPYASFTDNKGLFNIQYIVDGANYKKSASIKFSLPTDSEGASFVGFYTPLKFSDGYIDSVIPSAGLVSNLFIEKYVTRQPYNIVAGPNYGNIVAAGLVGPDHKYSQEELNIIEPFGVNCMVYRPNFGTFINANQTAKQTPVSALSKVHVRELVIYLQDEVEKVLQRYQWEFNNQRTRNAILDCANNICELVKANGGLIDYVNIMDESNNTPEIIDNEMAILSTHIEPGRGMGKMVHELHIYRTGQMKASIAE